MFKKLLVGLLLSTQALAALPVLNVSALKNGAVTFPVQAATVSQAGFISAADFARISNAVDFVGHEYYVAKNGNDSYPCGPVQPCLTIGRVNTLIGSAANSTDFSDLTQAFYRIHVGPGVYTETVSVPSRQYVEYVLNGALISGNVSYAFIGGTVATGTYTKTKLVFSGGTARNYYGGSGYPLESGISGNMTLTNTSSQTVVVDVNRVGVGGNIDFNSSAGAYSGLLFLNESIITGSITGGTGTAVTLYANNCSTSTSKGIGGTSGQIYLNRLNNVQFVGAVVSNAGTLSGAQWYGVKFLSSGSNDFTGHTLAVTADANSNESLLANVTSGNRSTVTVTLADTSRGVGYTPTGSWSNIVGTPTTVLGGLDNLATVVQAATSANTASAIVRRDVNGDSSHNVLTMANGAVTANGAASVPALKVTGAPYAGGTATTSKPQVLIEDSGTSTGWSAVGTYLGINYPAAFAGNTIDVQRDGVSKFKVDSGSSTTVTVVGAVNASVSVGTPLIQPTANNITLALQSTRTMTTASTTAVTIGSNTHSQTSGTNVAVSINPTYNQASGTAINTDLLINRTQTAVGSGAQLLIDAQVGAVSKFSVTNTGMITGGNFPLTGIRAPTTNSHTFDAVAHASMSGTANVLIATTGSSMTSAASNAITGVGAGSGLIAGGSNGIYGINAATVNDFSFNAIFGSATTNGSGNANSTHGYGAGPSTAGSTATSVFVGASSGSANTGSNKINIGYQAGNLLTSGGGTICMGSQSCDSVPIATANIFVAGSSGSPINNVYFGKGYVHATPTAYTIWGTGGSGTDIAGANLVLSGGAGTGSAASGAISFLAGAAGGGSSSTAVAPTERFKITAAAITNSTGVVASTTVKTTSGGYTQLATDEVVVINKASGAATAVTLLASPETGRVITIIDGKGDANTNNITITPAAGNINGAASYVINVAYRSVTLAYNGTEWNIKGIF